MISSAENDYPLHYGTEAADGSQLPMANVFVRRDAAIRHFWGSELIHRPYRSGNTRHVDPIWPLWNLLDLVPEGRGESWYPSLEPPR